MNVPKSWRTQKRANTDPKPSMKRQRTKKEKDILEEEEGNGVDSIHPFARTGMTDCTFEPDDMLQHVKNILSRNTDDTLDTSRTICTETVFSHVPYKKIIEEIYENCQTKIPSIPLITRAYEESFMRECCNKSEKRCAMEEECECMKIDPCNKFVGTEFLLPGESSDQTPRLCVLCHRQLTQKCYFDVMFDGKNFPFPIQKYGNICAVPGEYALEVMLICPPGGPIHVMPYPNVSHHRNRYIVVNSYGSRIIRQTRVAFEEYPTEQQNVNDVH